MAVWALKNLNEKRHGVATFSDGFYSTSDPLAGFNKENNGLPENPKLSALTGRVVSPRTVDERVDMYAGVYENMVGGAKIYKKSYIPTDVEDDNLTIREYRLYQNYPNPFNPATNIRYAIGNKQFVTLKVYDVLGNEVATLIDEYKPAGNYEVEFRSESGINQLVSGIYFYQLRTFDPLTNSGRVYVETKKMVLLK
ncbi:MAG: T9SS type A sorting domain-containing protein [Ignavibacteriota bacterium]|nr:T9SS C-terminal target domain-containing protein [Ignavibacteriota bacterium]MBW7842942.1 T9SS type A sorting domain-containing protein [Ignavibacterium sp.]MCO6446946.1 T9SS type A sorting domain-containing protein [Ignavibacterium album]QKK01011.1 MAG: T9SS type A sorting domain-containing protein [Ignavibacteriota bacterium]